MKWREYMCLSSQLHPQRRRAGLVDEQRNQRQAGLKMLGVFLSTDDNGRLNAAVVAIHVSHATMSAMESFTEVRIELRQALANAIAP